MVFYLNKELRFIVCSSFFDRLMGSQIAISHPNGLKLKTSASAILILIISLTLFLSNSDGSASEKDSSNNGVIVEQKLVLGSRPPGCFNKCLGCKPCKAALVISVRRRDGGGHTHMAMMASSSSEVHQRDEGYYLLSWKCKCGNKVFQP